MKNYQISEELADAILTYLAQQPYREVYQLIGRLQTLPETAEDSEETADTSS